MFYGILKKNAPVTISNGHTRTLTTQEQDLLRIYNAADGKKLMKIMNFVCTIEDEQTDSQKQ